MTRVLLLGATGFIGAHVHRALQAAPHVDEVVAVGRSTLELTVATVGDVTRVVDKVRPTVLVNCTGGLDGNSSDLIRWQTLTTALLLDALRDRDIRLVRLGSAGEYGAIERGTSVPETAPASPVSPYGISHLAATMLVDQASVDGHVDGVTVRVFNPIGRGSGPGSLLTRAAGEFVRARVEGGPVVFGRLDPFRDLVDARDVADAVVALVGAERTEHTVYNVGSGAAVRIRDAVHRLAEHAGYDGEVIESGGGAARSAGIDWTQADVGRIRAEFGWTATRTLDDALADILADTTGAPVPREPGKFITTTDPSVAGRGHRATSFENPPETGEVTWH